MKRHILFLPALVLAFSLAGCGRAAPGTAQQPPQGPVIPPAPSSEAADGPIPSFSYQEEREAWGDADPGVHYDGFKNADEVELDGAEDLIERAGQECTVSYSAVRVSYDSTEDMWKVQFYTESALDGEAVLGGDQTVYLDGSGVTRLVVYGE